MTALIDDLGVWQLLGTINLSFEQWQLFPIAATNGFSTFRINFNGVFNSETPVISYCYLREVYKTFPYTLSSKWYKIYPKPESQIIIIPVASEFFLQNVERFFEVIRKVKRYESRTNINDLSVTLEEFIPYPETVAKLKEVSLSQSIIEDIALNVADLLPLYLPEGE